MWQTREDIRQEFLLSQRWTIREKIRKNCYYPKYEESREGLLFQETRALKEEFLKDLTPENFATQSYVARYTSLYCSPKVQM